MVSHKRRQYECGLGEQEEEIKFGEREKENGFTKVTRLTPCSQISTHLNTRLTAPDSAESYPNLRCLRNNQDIEALSRTAPGYLKQRSDNLCNAARHIAASNSYTLECITVL